MSTNPFAEIREFLEGIADLQNRLQRWAQENSAQIAASFQQLQAGIAEFERYRSEEEAQDFATLAEGGWIGLERRFSYHEMRTAATICRANGTDAMNYAVLQYFSRDDCAILAKVIDDWQRVPYLKDREAIIRDAFLAHKSGQFTLSVPALLPLAEGLAADTLGIVSTRAVQIAAEERKSIEAEAWAAEFFNVVDQVIYKSYTFGKDAATYLNRHGILHGRVLDYASALNSTRVFLLIDSIVGIWESKQESLALAAKAKLSPTTT